MTSAIPNAPTASARCGEPEKPIGMKMPSHLREGIFLFRKSNRRKEISLTRRAWQLEPCITQYISALDRTLCAGISSNDLETTEQSLQVILQNTKSAESKVLE